MPRRREIRFPCSFAFRLTIEDANRLRAVADIRGIAPAEMARQIISQEIGLLYERRGTHRGLRHAELIRGLLTKLWRQGNNVNQIARAANVAGLSDRSDGPLAALPEIAATLARIERAILDAIGVQDGARL